MSALPVLLLIFLDNWSFRALSAPRPGRALNRASSVPHFPSRPTSVQQNIVCFFLLHLYPTSAQKSIVLFSTWTSVQTGHCQFLHLHRSLTGAQQSIVRLSYSTLAGRLLVRASSSVMMKQNAKAP
ncbi:hypothetical protein ASPVEDRAFT_445627 [Aspergillus versicolor CBS 583.65]|uniref:Secreted protein n=1 Tax=Aspergillus versicolor CBS 583.65 TaxID=1036611 RepID=A0A1L9P9E7_ASPVE|nr:uncharacterized protein ASPVEDRAFT_445627 [Aspergillus versicolor CBS 583.65]OJI98118.1 hypothetical protein ASPVEDRAFT_445627 [Aspergillus versicolor CBS 583.65]